MPSASGASQSPILVDELADEKEDTRIWRGDPDDWTRVRNTLRDFRSDGRRLEAWEHWLGLEERALLAHAADRLEIGMTGSKVRLDDWDIRYALDPASPVSNDVTPGTAGTMIAPPPHDILLPVLRTNVRFPLIMDTTSVLTCP
jgi:hypothetical protein